jgi:hypothetical protein
MLEGLKSGHDFILSCTVIDSSQHICHRSQLTSPHIKMCGILNVQMEDNIKIDLKQIGSEDTRRVRKVKIHRV